MAEIKNDFFSVVNIGDSWDIRICSQFLDFGMISQCGDLKPIAKGGKFRITGRSSVEAYFCLGYVLTFWGASSITGVGASGKDDLRIDLSQPRAAGNKKWLRSKNDGQGRTVAEILPSVSGNGLWPDGDQGLETPSHIPIPANGEFHLTGRGSVWMYMQLGISAALAGIQDVFISKPVVPYEIHINSDGLCEARTLESSPKEGVVVGILGKPNSGKSVFSRNFAVAIRKLMPPEFTSWIYDCDLASPTPDWYLNDSAGTEEIRKSIKQKWTAELECKAAKDLATLRNNLDLTLADMPGGRGDGADWKGIPSPTRAEMLKVCDAYIVICKQSGSVNPDDVYSDWHKALEEYQLEDRIVARIVSADPEKDFTVSALGRDEDGIFTATITGLDRKKNRDAVIRYMTAGLRPLIEEIAKSNDKRKKP